MKHIVVLLVIAVVWCLAMTVLGTAGFLAAALVDELPWTVTASILGVTVAAMVCGAAPLAHAVYHDVYGLVARWFRW